MKIDDILHPSAAPPTREQMRAGFDAVVAIAEALRMLAPIPSGHVYATMAGSGAGLSLEAYNRVLEMLKSASLIRVDSSHVIHWTGPILGKVAN